MKLRRLLIFAAFVLLTGPSVAQPPPAVVTLAELEDLAQRNNPTLVQAAARIQAARGEYLQAGLHPNPRIAYQGNEIGDEGRAGQQGVLLGQELVTAGKLQWNRAVAAEGIRQAECAAEAQRCRVLYDVRRGYFDVLVAQSTAELTEQLVRLGDEAVKTAEGLFEAKEVARFDVLQARIEADSTGVLLEKAKNRHLAAWRGLAAVVGVPDLTPAPLAGQLEDGMVELTWEVALQRVLGESPVLARAWAGVSRAQAALGRECAARVPNIDLEFGVLYDNATRDTIAEVQLGVPIPLFNRNQGNICRAQAELAAARDEVDRVRLEMQQRLAATFEQYVNARFEADKYKNQILPNAKASLDLVAAGYRQGEFNYLMLLTAQRTFFHANLAYVEALRELRATAAAIEGGLLGDSLQEGR